jgi:hypothetical protein
MIKISYWFEIHDREYRMKWSVLEAYDHLGRIKPAGTKGQA